MRNFLYQIILRNPDRKKLYFSLCLTFLFILGAALCGVSLPIVLKKIIDQLTRHSTLHDVMGLFVCYALIMFLQRVLSEFQFAVYAPWECGVVKSTFDKVYESLFFNKAKFFNATLHGSITSKIFQGVMGLDALMFDCVFKITPIVLETVLIMSSITFIFDFRMTLIIGCGVGFYMGCIYIFNSKLLHCQNEIRNSVIHAQGVTTDFIASWKDIKLTQSYPFVTRVLNAVTKNQVDKSSAFYKKRGVFGFMQSMPICATFLLANYQAISSYTKGYATIGGILLINNYLFQILRPIESLSLLFRSITKNYSDFTMLSDILKNEKELPNEHAEKEIIHHMWVKNVSVEGILQNVNFSLRKGDKIAIIGQSGSGKTTLLNVLAGENTEYGGDIFINGKNLKNNPALKNNIAYFHRDARLIKDTVQNNIALGKPTEINAALKFSGMSKKIDSLDEGVETIVSESASTLSAGEIQRLKMARTFLLHRDIEIYDEATSCLNQELEEDILKRMFANKEKIIIFVTHRLHFLSQFDKVYQLKNGLLTEHVKEHVNYE